MLQQQGQGQALLLPTAQRGPAAPASMHSSSMHSSSSIGNTCSTPVPPPSHQRPQAQLPRKAVHVLQHKLVVTQAAHERSIAEPRRGEVVVEADVGAPHRLQGERGAAAPSRLQPVPACCHCTVHSLAGGGSPRSSNGPAAAKAASNSSCVTCLHIQRNAPGAAIRVERSRGKEVPHPKIVRLRDRRRRSCS